MKMLVRAFLLCLIGCLPALAYAQGIFDVPATDKSMEYLGMVFGSVAGLPIQASGNPFFNVLIYYFNQIVFALALVLVVVLTIVGTVTTAQEGEVLGKKWSTLLIPARAGLGMYLLLPTANNYNWIQIAVMWFIVQGVGAANSLWHQVITSNMIHGSVNSDTREVDLKNAAQAVSLIFSNVMCMQKLNDKILTDPYIRDNMGNEFISAFLNPAGDQVNLGRATHPEEQPLCGYITVPTVGGSVGALSSGTGGQERQLILGTAILSAISALEPAAAEAATPSTGWSFANSFVDAARALQGATENLATTFTAATEVQQQALEDGWLFAGSYYFQLITEGAYNDINVSVGGGGMNTAALSTLLGPSTASQLISEINNQSEAYVDYVAGTIKTVSPAEAFEGTLTPVFTPPADVQGVFAAMFGETFFSDLATSLGKQITTGCLSDSTDPNQQNADPLICMATFGANLASSIELTFWSALVAIFVLWLATGMFSCIQPLAHTMNFMLTIIIPILMVIISLLWAAGISLALYVPLIPYLVFSFAALSWIILVIEAMLGAPLIALTLILPSEDELGKAGRSLMMLLGIFFRPPLMILGFIFGIKLLTIAVGMLNFGFASTISMSVAGGVGLFGFVSIFILYAGLAIGLVHEAFSLIYILPDKILRWMGEQGEGIEVGSQVRDIGATADKGGAMGAKAMKAGAGWAQGKISKG